VARALAKSRAERWQRAAEMRAALLPSARVCLRTRAWVGAAVLGLLVGLPTVLSGQCPDGSPRVREARDARHRPLRDPSFEHRAGGQQSTLDGADCAEFAHGGLRALDRSPACRQDTRLRRAGAPRRARSVSHSVRHRRRHRPPARRGKAGDGAVVELWRHPAVDRGLYDVTRGGTPLREITTRVPGDRRDRGGDSTRSPIHCSSRSRRCAGDRRRADRVRFMPCVPTPGPTRIRAWDWRGASSHFVAPSQRTLTSLRHTCGWAGTSVVRRYDL